MDILSVLRDKSEDRVRMQLGGGGGGGSETIAKYHYMKLRWRAFRSRVNFALVAAHIEPL